MWIVLLPVLCLGSLLIDANTRDCLQSANAYRAKHQNTPLLVWDATLARKAQRYAQVLLNQGIRNYGYVHLRHDPRNNAENMGENLWWADSKKNGDDLAICKQADKDWYKEINNYNWKTTRSKGGVITHFTQMVWVGTKKVGYGVAVGKVGDKWKQGFLLKVVVAKYQEPGNFNMLGQRIQDYSRNVQPLKGMGGGGSGNQGMGGGGSGNQGCTDSDRLCGSWQRRGECENNPIWMGKNCKVSCRTCRCKDFYKECSKWEKDGECQANLVWMSNSCPLSCGTCTCKDGYDECPKWKGWGECSKNRDWMARNCKKSCKTCTQSG